MEKDALKMMYPFAVDLSSEYNAEHSNHVEKVRAWYENRERYCEIVKEYPWERIHCDVEKEKIKYKGAKKEKNPEQFKIF